MCKKQQIIFMHKARLIYKKSMIKCRQKRFIIFSKIIEIIIVKQTQAMIQKLQKISAQLFKNALKTYSMKEVLVHKRASAHNPIQMFSLYPNKGQGFIIRKKNWTAGLYYQVKRAQYKSYRHGTLYGSKYKQNSKGINVIQDQYPKRLNGMNKRGCWTYELGNFHNQYNRADFEAFMKIRKIGIPANQNKSEEAASAQEVEQTQEQVDEKK